MKVSSRCYAVTGLGYIPPWEVNAGFAVGACRADDLRLCKGRVAFEQNHRAQYGASFRPYGRELLLRGAGRSDLRS